MANVGAGRRARKITTICKNPQEIPYHSTLADVPELMQVEELEHDIGSHETMLNRGMTRTEEGEALRKATEDYDAAFQRRQDAVSSLMSCGICSVLQTDRRVDI